MELKRLNWKTSNNSSRRSTSSKHTRAAQRSSGRARGRAQEVGGEAGGAGVVRGEGFSCCTPLPKRQEQRRSRFTVLRRELWKNNREWTRVTTREIPTWYEEKILQRRAEHQDRLLKAVLKPSWEVCDAAGWGPEQPDPALTPPLVQAGGRQGYRTSTDAFQPKYVCYFSSAANAG